MRRMGKSCPRCGQPMLSFTRMQWGCSQCGHQARGPGPGVRFRASGPPHLAALRTQRRAPRPRRGASAVVLLGLGLLAVGLGTAAFVLLTDPDGALALGLQTTRSAQPSDFRAPPAQSGMYHREFTWEYRGTTYRWSMNITEDSYESFKELDRPVRRYQENGVWHVQPAYDLYVSHRDDDPFIDALAQALMAQARKEPWYSSDETLSFTLAFVQSLPYTRDDVTTSYDEYPRYPVETLVDNGGDCEDTSILYASLVLAMGYGAIMVSPPQHMAVGVQAAEGFEGVIYRYGGQTYAYAETTGDGYGLGEIPDEYAGKQVAVYDLMPKPLFSLEVEFGAVTADGHQEVRMRAQQTGSATAEGVQLRATVGSEREVFDAAVCDLGSVAPGGRVECTLRLDLNRVPRGAKVSIHCQVQDRTYVYDQADSMPWVPRH